MTQAERIREYYKDNPSASYDEVAEILNASNGNVRANISKDIKAGRCIRLEDGSLDYSSYFNSNTSVADLRDWKNDIRHELVEQLMRAIRNEVEGEKIRTLSKEINRLLKEITK